ncbi:MAG TPA: L,D-transpeptidase [Nostocaceae cyanobacterium]|nr:L,D-transpeptidase [Nostocaceae cyanobacterium]
MKSLLQKWINPRLLHRSQIFFLGAAVSFSLINLTSSPTLANLQKNAVEQTIENLKNSEQRWIQVDLSAQNLTAWEGNKPVYAVKISSGKKSTPTLTGSFKIQSKLKTTRMRGRGYDVPNVPHAMFYDGNYGIHGAYWHKSFGTPVSHGCVNLAPDHAKWLFNWASVGTPVIVQK